MANVSPPRSRDGFEIAIVCALKLERDAVEVLMEVDFKEQGYRYGKANGDRNAYTTGLLGSKPVVLAYPRDMGSLNAAAVANDMRYSFKNIKIGLVVGVTGGAPQTPDETEVLLGDVVISTAVVQYDFGRQYPDGFRRKSGVESTLGRVSAEIANFLTLLDGYRARERLTIRTNEYRNSLVSTTKILHPGPDHDYLFPSGYRHKHQDPQSCQICSKCSVWYNPVCNEAEKSSCDELGCDKRNLLRRRTATTQEVQKAKVHFGRIASANAVMKSGIHRDKVVANDEVIAFEMEGAGTWDQFPTVVVKSVCDYADSHKNKAWQKYAAATAASCAKAILEEWETSDQFLGTAEPGLAGNPARSHIYMPFSKSWRFVGRKTELEKLEHMLLAEKHCQDVALVGLGGIGKTQVALSFAYSVREKHPGFSVFWVPAMSRETVERAFEDIAGMLGLLSESENENNAEVLLRRHLSATAAGKWLLIVDNIDDMEMLNGDRQTESLLNQLPRSTLGLTLFTTRNQEIAQSLTGSDVIEIERMQPEEAMTMLEQAIVRKESINDKVARSALLRELDNLPLAITQAAAYINVNKISISKYLSLVTSTEQNMINVMSKEIRDSTRYEKAANAVATTWIISFQQIAERDADAVALLQYISCIEWKAIPHSILPRVEPEARMTSVIGLLCSYSFLAPRHDKTMYDMHRLVHVATRIWDLQHDRQVETRQKAVLHLSRIFPFGEYVNRDIWREYLPHAARINKDTTGQDIDGRAELYKRIGYCLYVDGKAKDAIVWLEESCYCLEELAEDHPNRLASQHVLAGVYQSNGQVKEAVKLLERVVAIEERVLAEDHPSRLASQHELAGVYQSNGQVKEAVKLLEHVVAIEERVLAEDHPSRLASQHELARVYQSNGQVKEAVKLLEHVVAIQERVLAKDHPNRLASQHELAGVYQSNGQVKEAVKLLERVVAIQERVLAEDHPSRLASQHELARVYQSNGQVKEAVKLLKHVVAIRERVLAEDHPNRLVSQHVLAGVYQSNGQVKEAVKLLEHVVAIQERVLAKDHPNRLASQHELAGVYQSNGQVKEAVKLLERVVAIQERVLAEDHPSQLASQHELARVYQSNGQVKEAVKLLEHVVAIRERVLAEDHPDRLASQHVLAGVYQSNGQVKEAVKLLERVVAIQERVLAEDHPNRLASQHELARVYQSNGQVKEAVKLLEHVVAIEERVLAEDHPSRLASQHELARVYQSNGQVKEAVKLLEHVVAIQERVLAEDHPNRLVSQHVLAGVYQLNGQVKEAVKLLEHVVAIQERVLAKDHPNRLASQHELARVYQSNGQVKEAVKLLERVVAIQERVLAEDHPSRLASQHELARVYQSNGQVKEAVKLLEHVVAIQERVLAEDYPNRLASQHVLAGVYQSNGQVKEAVKLLEHVVAIQERVLAKDYPNRLASQYELARVYQSNGQVKEAVKLLERVVAIEERVLAEDYPLRLASQHELARVYQSNGQVKEAVKLLEHVVAIEERVLAEDHPDRLTSERALEKAYRAYRGLRQGA